ncbi:Putative invertase inhibitor [Triticum urartu]|uniref:Putative invertase inhibitor n=1 Tax=Triticum urartu TaxID=4572 RepID=M7Z6L8_TRIUA|nr:Putative invertase inhibitor [Triticum urartu]
MMRHSQALSQLAVLLLLFLLVSSSAASTLDDTCKSVSASNRDLGYDYCVKFFKACKDSATADKRGLAVIATKIIRAAAVNTGRRIATIKASHGDDRRIQGPLADCDELYSSAVDQLDAAARGISSGKFQDALTNLSAAADAPQTCEEGFRELGVSSPLADEDSKFSKECSIALAVTNTFGFLLFLNNDLNALIFIYEECERDLAAWDEMPTRGTLTNFVRKRCLPDKCKIILLLAIKYAHTY